MSAGCGWAGCLREVCGAGWLLAVSLAIAEEPLTPETTAEPPAIRADGEPALGLTDPGEDLEPALPPAIAAAPAPPPKPAAAPQPWKNLLFENDFSDKKSPEHQWLLGENLKDLAWEDLFGEEAFPETTLSFGGELRMRLMNEKNRLRPLGNTELNAYELWRWRNYLHWKHSDWLRVYAEMIDASIFQNDLPPTGIDLNRWDMQNYFVDVAPLEFDGQKVWLRTGRQELLYGSQRLVSPLDWANTRRNFEGLKIFTKGEAWDFDLWVTNPVNTATPNNGPLSKFDYQFDQRNRNRVFSGAWSTYKGVKDHVFDYYFLWDHTTQNNAGGPNLPAYPLGDRMLLATRWLGNHAYSDDATVHAEVEGGYQFGTDFGDRVQAGFVTVGAGHTWKNLWGEPNFWFYYDWASGSNNPDGTVDGTFFQYFGLVHAYLGLIDNISRQNITDLNWRWTIKPHKKVTFMAAQHFFAKANSADYLYNVTGSRVGQPNTGTNVGQEIDLLLTYNHNANFSLETGYFWFLYGSVLDSLDLGTAHLYYLQTTFRY